MDAYIVRLAVLVTVLFNPQVLMADPLVFDDGGEHIIDSLVTNDTIIIRAGTTVRVMSGGVTPTVELRGGQLLVDGGSVGSLIQSDSDDDSRFVMTAGEVRDFITKLGGHAEILGGTVVGNVRVTIGPLRVAGDARIGSISGGGFATGLLRIEGGHIGQIRLGLDAFANLQFAGGTIESVLISIDDGGTFEMTGGELCCGPARIATGSIFAGSIGTLLEVRSLDLFGGVLTGGVSASGSPGGDIGIFADILGGSISGPDFALRGFDSSSFNVRGGLFGSAFVGHDDTTFSIFGRGLRFDGATLRGFLEDGSRIEVPVQLFDRAQVRLVAVPEAGTLALLLGGLAGLILVRVTLTDDRAAS